MGLEPTRTESTSSERDLLHLVAASVKSFVRSQNTCLRELESGEPSNLPAGIAKACEQLGWLGSLSAPDPLSELGGPVLPCLLFELGLASPTLSAALLSHHVALALLRAVSQSPRAPLPQPNGDPSRCGWFALSPYCLLAPNHPTHGLPNLPQLVVRGTALEGTLPWVVRPHESAPVLAFAETPEGQTQLLCIPRLSTAQVTGMVTLGLRGLGLCDVHLEGARLTEFDVLSAGVDRRGVADEVWKSALPAFAALASSVLSQCQTLADSHAASRWQAGKLIQDLPQVKEKLRLIERHRSVTQLIARAVPEDAQIARGWFATIGENLLEATDAGLQVMGGSGYVVGTGMERLWRDARQLSVLLG